MKDLKQIVRELAYKKWQEAGSPPGDGKDFWQAAEEELEHKPKKVAAKTSAKNSKGTSK